MPKCLTCGKRFTYKNVKGKAHPVDGTETCFVPDETSGTEYVNKGGHVIKGRPSSDGQKGYKIHGCVGVMQESFIN